MYLLPPSFIDPQMQTMEDMIGYDPTPEPEDEEGADEPGCEEATLEGRDPNTDARSSEGEGVSDQVRAVGGGVACLRVGLILRCVVMGVSQKPIQLTGNRVATLEHMEELCL